MIHQVAWNEARFNLFDLIEAAFRGETVFITKDNQQSVQLIPITQPKHRPSFGSAKGLIVMDDDFDAPLADFSEYMA